MYAVQCWYAQRAHTFTNIDLDFDGDEMNMHLPQTEEAKAEAVMLMGTQNNIVTPRNGEPLISATQDFITCCFLMTGRDIFYDRSQFAQICCYMGDSLLDVKLPPPAIIRPVTLWTGKQVFSVLMKSPPVSMNISSRVTSTEININLETKGKNFIEPSSTNAASLVMDKSMCINESYFIVYNSEIMSGRIDKSIIGDGSKNSLFYVALRDYGSPTAADFMNKTAKLSARWMGNQGFSIGIDDVQASPSLQKEKNMVVEDGFSQCDELIAKAVRGDLVPAPGLTVDATLEAQISGVLSKIRNQLGEKCISGLPKSNAPLIMTLCGSKGTFMPLFNTA